MELKIKKLSKHAKIPERMTDGSSGFDLFACLPLQHCSLHHRGRILVPCGISLEIPPGYEGQIRPRSGLAAKSGITVLNTPGTIDSDYRGEIFVLLANLGGLFCRIEHGMRIAQIVFAPIVIPELIEVECLSTTERDADGFGSTGDNK